MRLHYKPGFQNTLASITSLHRTRVPPNVYDGILHSSDTVAGHIIDRSFRLAGAGNYLRPYVYARLNNLRTIELFVATASCFAMRSQPPQDVLRTVFAPNLFLSIAILLNSLKDVHRRMLQGPHRSSGA